MSLVVLPSTGAGGTQSEASSLVQLAEVERGIGERIDPLLVRGRLLSGQANSEK